MSKVYRIFYALLLFHSLLHTTDSFMEEETPQSQQNPIYFVHFAFTDIIGNLKEVIQPAQQAQTTCDKGTCFDGSSIQGFTSISESDLLLIPDTNACFNINPNGSTSAIRIFCSAYLNEEEPCPTDSQHVLRNALKKANNMGYDFLVGPEIEFFIFNEDTPCDTHGYFDAITSPLFTEHQRILLALLTQWGIRPEKIHHEVAPGQYEISLEYDNALNIAHRIMLARHGIKQYIHQIKSRASFNPKPLENDNGNGMHMHFSLFDIEKGYNAFYDINDIHNLSHTAKQFIAGVLKYTPELTAIFNATPESYERLVPGCEAPTYCCWGTKNRSAMIRIPFIRKDSPNSVRAELRSPDNMCNPYLAFAALLHAGLKGIEENLTLSAAIEESLYTLNEKELKEKNILTLPTSFNEALTLLNNSVFAREVLGNSLVDAYITAKRAEYNL